MHDETINELLAAGYKLYDVKDIKHGFEVPESDGFLFTVTSVTQNENDTTTIFLKSDFSSYKSHQGNGKPQTYNSNEQLLAKPPTIDLTPEPASFSSQGFSKLTDIFFKLTEVGTVEAKMGIEFMSSDDGVEERLKACNHDPFHENFKENYVNGVGNTREEAISELRKDMQSLENHMWM